MHVSTERGGELVELQGRVRSLREINARTCELGIEFEDVSPEAYETLDEYLQLQAD